jgi:hypothetical protein
MHWTTLRNRAVGVAAFAMCGIADAQGIADPWVGTRIDAMRIVLAIPPDAPAGAGAFKERARGVLDLYPGTSFRNLFRHLRGVRHAPDSRRPEAIRWQCARALNSGTQG